jgi:hypothetical protein
MTCKYFYFGLPDIKNSTKQQLQEKIIKNPPFAFNYKLKNIKENSIFAFTFLLNPVKYQISSLGLFVLLTLILKKIHSREKVK